MEVLNGNIVFVYSGNHTTSTTNTLSMISHSPLKSSIKHIPTIELNAVECWLSEGDANIVISLSGDLFRFESSLRDLSNANDTAIVEISEPKTVHVSLLNSLNFDHTDSESAGTASANVSASKHIEWMMKYRMMACKLLLYREHISKRLTGCRDSVLRLDSSMNIRGQPAISRVDNDRTNASSTAYINNPADLFDSYTTNQRRRHSSKGSGIVNAPRVILESTRSPEYVLTAYSDGTIQGMFADYSIVNIISGTEVIYM